jgi:hypothetical protein
MLFDLILLIFSTATSTLAFHIPHHQPSTPTSPTPTLNNPKPRASIYSSVPLYDPANRYKVFTCLSPKWGNCTKTPADHDPGIAGQCYNIEGEITGFDPYPEQLCRMYDVEECAATAEDGTWNSMDVWFPGFDNVKNLEWEEGKELKALRSWRCVEPGKIPIP